MRLRPSMLAAPALAAVTPLASAAIANCGAAWSVPSTCPAAICRAHSTSRSRSRRMPLQPAAATYPQEGAERPLPGEWQPLEDCGVVLAMVPVVLVAARGPHPLGEQSARPIDDADPRPSGPRTAPAGPRGPPPARPSARPSDRPSSTGRGARRPRGRDRAEAPRPRRPRTRSRGRGPRAFSLARSSMRSDRSRAVTW